MQSLWLKNPSTRRSCSYIFDWVFCVILLILFFLLDRVEPFHREFSVENPSIMYPYQEKERVPVWALVLIAVIFPVLLMAVVALGVRRSPYDFHNGVLGLLLSILLTTMFMQVIKVTVGKHRPDFLSRCKPEMDGKVVVLNPPLQLWTIDLCTQTDKHILKDGMRSFPSGHASTAFAGLVYIALWMGGKMHVFDRRGYSLKSVLLILPIIVAMLVAISRVEDYRHAGVDVTWGAIIGIMFAFFAYLQYYPSLTSAHSEIPFPPRDFSYLIANVQGRTEESSHLENAVGIRPNEEFIDESRQFPEPAVEEVGRERGERTTGNYGGGGAGEQQQTNNQVYNNCKDNSGNQFTSINMDNYANHGVNGINPVRRNNVINPAAAAPPPPSPPPPRV